MFEEFLQFAWMEGLDEPVIETGGDRRLPVFILSKPGYRGEDCFLETGPLSELPGEFASVHSGHADVGQHDVGFDFLRINRVEHLPGRVEYKRIVTHLAYQRACGIGKVGLIVHDDHLKLPARHRARSTLLLFPGRDLGALLAGLGKPDGNRLLAARGLS
jgi:hypothetical protein